MGVINSFFVNGEDYTYQDELNIAEEYYPNNNYYPGDIVYYEGQLYICIASTSEDFNYDDWESITLIDAIQGLEYGIEDFYDLTDEIMDSLYGFNISTIDLSKIETEGIVSVLDRDGFNSQYSIETDEYGRIKEIYNMETGYGSYIIWPEEEEN